jgi:hypothetical protein
MSDGKHRKQWRKGTPFSAPQVFGQVAIILSNPEYYGLVYEPGAGKTAEKVMAIIQNAAYPRSSGEPPVL